VTPLPIGPGIEIADQELEERFVRASGPGGQHVNKVATAVQLRFDLAGSRSLPAGVRERLARLAGRRLSAEGVLVIEARRFRERERNRRDARQRLVALVRRALEAPRPRRPTAPGRAARERRLEAKHHRARIKRARRELDE